MNDTPTLAGRIRRDLYAIADTYDEALDPVRRASGSQVKASKEPPLPIGAHVLDVRRDACADLTNWAGFIIDEIRDINGDPITALVRTHPAALVPFIATWVDRVIEQFPNDADMWATKAEKHAKALEGITNPAYRDWMPIGECPVTVADADGNSVPCGAMGRAYNREATSVVWSSEEDAPEPKRIQFIQCPGCGTEDTLAWWMSQIVPEGSDLAHADAVIACVVSRTMHPLTHEQLRQWASRGNIRRHGKDVKGRTLYSSAAVLAYAQGQVKEDVA